MSKKDSFKVGAVTAST